MPRRPRIELAAGVGDGLERILTHLLEHDVADPAARIEEILAVIDILRRSPEIGRPISSGLRELVLGRGSRGYVAFYWFQKESNIVFVLAVRGRRETGYGP